jgi:predicted GIY-YIG superfamily endonuclease
MKFHFNFVFPFVYSLELDENYYYCGWTRDLQLRLMNHMSGNGSAKWTKLHKPIRLINLSVGGTGKNEEENKETLRMMRVFGKDRVRGGNWSAVENKQVNKLDIDDCFSQNHWVKLQDVNPFLSFLYILELKDGKYFCGLSEYNINLDLQQHKRQSYCEWTRIHPIKGLIHISFADREMFLKRAIQLVKKYGVENIKTDLWEYVESNILNIDSDDNKYNPFGELNGFIDLSENISDQIHEINVDNKNVFVMECPLYYPMFYVLKLNEDRYFVGFTHNLNEEIGKLLSGTKKREICETKILKIVSLSIGTENDAHSFINVFKSDHKDVQIENDIWIKTTKNHKRNFFIPLKIEGNIKGLIYVNECFFKDMEKQKLHQIQLNPHLNITSVSDILRNKTYSKPITNIVMPSPFSISNSLESKVVKNQVEKKDGLSFKLIDDSDKKSCIKNNVTSLFKRSSELLLDINNYKRQKTIQSKNIEDYEIVQFSWSNQHLRQYTKADSILFYSLHIIYVLLLEENKFFCGFSERVPFDVSEHLLGKRLHQTGNFLPIQLIRAFNGMYRDFESECQSLCKQYGPDNVFIDLTRILAPCLYDTPMKTS